MKSKWIWAGVSSAKYVEIEPAKCERSAFGGFRGFQKRMRVRNCMGNYLVMAIFKVMIWDRETFYIRLFREFMPISTSLHGEL